MRLGTRPAVAGPATTATATAGGSSSELLRPPRGTSALNDLQLKLRFHTGDVRRAVLSGGDISYAGLVARVQQLTETREPLWSFRYHDGVEMVGLANEHDFQAALHIAAVARRASSPGNDAAADTTTVALEVFVQSLAAAAAGTRGATDPPGYEAIVTEGGAAAGAGQAENRAGRVLADQTWRPAVQPVLELGFIVYSEGRPALQRMWTRASERGLVSLDGWKERLEPLSFQQRLVFAVVFALAVVLPVVVLVHTVVALVGPLLSIGWTVLLIGVFFVVVRWIAVAAQQHHLHAQ